MRAPHAIQPSLMSLFRPRHPWYGPSDVCPSPFLAECPSFISPRHTWLGLVAMCVICIFWLCRVGSPCDRPVFVQDNTAFSYFFGCGLPGTPLHVPLLGLGGMECYVVVARLRTW